MASAVCLCSFLFYVLVPPVNAALTPAQKITMLNYHNTQRGQVQPPAADMQEMSWDDRLAAVAETYARRCRFQHSASSERVRDYRAIGGPPTGIGENLYAHTSPDGNIAVQQGLNFFWQERNSYDYNTNRCTNNQECNHYRQMVWHSSFRLGCGMHRCSTLPPFTNSPSWNIVCMYAPAGNVFVQTANGLVSRKPYITGTRCSRCPQGWGPCRNGQCIAGDEALEAKVKALENGVAALERGLAAGSQPSAHLNGGRNQITVVEGAGDLTFWNPSDGHMTGGFTYSNGRLIVPQSGYYFVYSQIWNFQSGASVRHFLLVDGRRLMASGTRNGGSQASWTGGVFLINKGQAITVRLARRPSAQRTVWPGRAHTFFGAFKL